MSVFERPNTQPVGLHQVRQLVDRETGEVRGLAGLNTDPERCPAETCPECPRKACRCAPCRCPECLTRGFVLGRRPPVPIPRRELV